MTRCGHLYCWACFYKCAARCLSTCCLPHMIAGLRRHLCAAGGCRRGLTASGAQCARLAQTRSTCAPAACVATQTRCLPKTHGDMSNLAQVTPIYSRGREPLDPRKANPRPSECAEDPPEASVPRRPPGQRAPAVDVRCLLPLSQLVYMHELASNFDSSSGKHASGHAPQASALMLFTKQMLCMQRSTLVVADPFFQAHGALHSLSTLFGLHSTSSECPVAASAADLEFRQA